MNPNLHLREIEIEPTKRSINQENLLIELELKPTNRSIIQKMPSLRKNPLHKTIPSLFEEKIGGSESSKEIVVHDNEK